MFHNLSSVALLSLALMTAPGHAATPKTAGALSQQSSAELQKVRAALDKYKDPIVAVRDGYLSTLACIEFPNPAKPGEMPYPVGAMGVHFLNPGLISPKLDPMHPQVLIYEPVGDKLQLVAAEYFVPSSTGIKQRPELFGHPFDGPMAGHYPIMSKSMTHYDLHVWLWKANPAGLFKGSNPEMKCPATGYTFKDEAPKIIKTE